VFSVIWKAGPDGSNIAQRSNDWSGNNSQRYNNPEYDAIYDALVSETDAEAAAQKFIQLNDILINDYVMVPLVNRAAEVYGISTTLNNPHPQPPPRGYPARARARGAVAMSAFPLSRAPAERGRYPE